MTWKGAGKGNGKGPIGQACMPCGQMQMMPMQMTPFYQPQGKASRRKGNSKGGKPYNDAPECKCCGKKGHLKEICYRKEKTCSNCDKKGHLAKGMTIYWSNDYLRDNVDMNYVPCRTNSRTHPPLEPTRLWLRAITNQQQVPARRPPRVTTGRAHVRIRKSVCAPSGTTRGPKTTPTR